MKIKTLHIKNFSVLKDAEFTFSPQINVLIGTNGAGKTHVLKLMYAALRVHQNSSIANSNEDLAVKLKSKLAGTFMPDEGAVGRLVTRGTGRSKATVRLTAKSSPKARLSADLAFSISTLSRVKIIANSLPASPSGVFIPSREVLAMYEGFVRAYEERELSFDETYRDICIQLSGAQLRGPRLAIAKKIAQPLEKLLGGAIRLNGGRFYRFATGGTMEAHLLSEGLRKLGVLTHLVVNGSLIKNGFLFWDEPEASLNPKLVTTVAQTLRRLAAHGIQIFIASHDFLLINELALADDYGRAMKDGIPSVDVQFIGLNLSSNGSRVDVQVATRLRDLLKNDILAEFSKFYDRKNRLMFATGD